MPVEVLCLFWSARNDEAMARSYRPVLRDQEFLLPPNMAEWLAADHLVWFVIDAVAQMDLAAFYSAYRADGHGRAAYEPAMMA